MPNSFVIFEGQAGGYEYWQGLVSGKRYAWDRDETIYIITEGDKLIPSFETSETTHEKIEELLRGREAELLESSLQEEATEHQKRIEQGEGADEFLMTCSPEYFARFQVQRVQELMEADRC